MVEAVTNGHKEVITSLFREVNKSIKIISPFLSQNTAKMLCEASKNGIECTFITRFYLQDFIDGSNNLDGIQQMLDAGVSVYALIGLHTKLYLFDDNDAVVGSANFTEGGLSRNVELSIYFSDEAIIDDLQLYFREIEKKILSVNDGVISSADITEYREHFNRIKQKSKKVSGGTEFNYKRKGAAIDVKSRRIKNDDNEFHADFIRSINERKTDVVYKLLDGNNEDISYKSLANILLKFSASAKHRYDGSKKMALNGFYDNGKLFYMTNFSLSRKGSALRIEDGDETFFCVHSYDEKGNQSPMIVGKGHLRSFKHNNDARIKGWYGKYDWLVEYPLYCIINDAKIIDAPVSMGIPLREVVDELGYRTYINTMDKPEEYPKEKVYKSHGQQAIKHLSYDAKVYIDSRLEELWGKYGFSIYESE